MFFQMSSEESCTISCRCQDKKRVDSAKELSPIGSAILHS